MNATKHIELPAIEFRNVSLSFDTNPVLIDISFRLEKGEMVFLTGISGSGKSVLLRLAMGLLKPDTGQIFIEGREIETLEETELLTIRGGLMGIVIFIEGREIETLEETELLTIRGGLMGIVFQEDSLFTGLTVYENAAYRLEEHGWTEEETKKAVADVLQFVGLQGEEDKFPEELSGGMKRRLEIARALIGWPRIMLFDEPTMSLDPIVAVQVFDLVIRARDINRISSLYVTKKIYEIPQLANFCASKTADGRIKITEALSDALPKTRVMVLADGKIVFTGTPDEFQKSDHPAIKGLIQLDHHDHSKDLYFTNPWDKRRHPKEKLL